VTESSTIPTSDDEAAVPGRRRVTSTGHRLYWWVEVAAIGVFYGVYSGIRNANEGSPGAAYDHARSIISLERAIGLYQEERLQDWASHVRPLVLFCNYFYGSLHFILTVAILVFLYRRHTDSYPLWRNTLAVTTALALIGFITFPLMPPRLLDAHVLSAGLDHGPYGFVDTLARDPAFWSFNSGAVNEVSNQFAAMPSLHFAWSTWCVWAGAPHIQRRWLRILLHTYPWVTLTAIVLTANHYIIDAVAGGAIFVAGYLVARLCTRAGRRPIGEPARLAL
jgi:hypothetical protein